MYYVYKITNKINNKCYIGLTKHPEKRWNEHIKKAFCKSDTYNYLLQTEIREFGKENFAFIILHSNIMSKSDGLKLEQFEINKNNSTIDFGHGYNKDKRKVHNKPCAEVDIFGNIIKTFYSTHDAAEYYGDKKYFSKIACVCRGSVNSDNGKIFRYIDENGEIIDKVVSRRARRTKICSINVFDLNDIQYFESILAASVKSGCNRQSIQKCIYGNKRYTTVGKKIWRKIDNYNNIIDNDISIYAIHERYIKKYEENMGCFRPSSMSSGDT